MIHSLPPFMRDVENAIAEVEKRSAAELIVAISPWSGHYRDTDLIAGILFAVLALLIILFAPWDVPVLWVVPQVLLGGAAGWFLGRQLPALRRVLTSGTRRAAQVTAEASRAFHEEQVDRTRDRSGILLFVSLGEEEARIVPDHGVLQRVPTAEWQKLELELTRALTGKEWIARMASTIRAAGERLEATFPVGADDVDELPNTVRIRA